MASNHSVNGMSSSSKSKPKPNPSSQASQGRPSSRNSIAASTSRAAISKPSTSTSTSTSTPSKPIPLPRKSTSGLIASSSSSSRRPRGSISNHPPSTSSPLSRINNNSSSTGHDSTSEWVNRQSNHTKQDSNTSTVDVKKNGAHDSKDLQVEDDDLDLDRVGFIQLNDDIWKEEALKDGDGLDNRKVLWLDIDNTLYPKSTRIASLMAQKITSYFQSLNLPPEEAKVLHQKYYKEYGLAIRGLVKHHEIDALEYDSRCDSSLELDEILKPDVEVRKWLEGIDRSKVRVVGLTNAYKIHALRVLSLLNLSDLLESLIYCNYERSDFACKPETNFYHLAMKRIGVQDESLCYFVDDSKLNINSAKKIGWGNCIWFDEEDEDEEEGGAVVGEGKTNEERAINKEFNGKSSMTLKEFESSPSNSQLPGNLISNLPFNQDLITTSFQKLSTTNRLKYLSIILDACLPGDILSMKDILEKHLKSTKDVVSLLPDEICLKVFEKLRIPELLQTRLISNKWSSLSKNPDLWKSHALALTESDPVPLSSPENPEDWEKVVKDLFFRERNWIEGLAQNVQFFKGHSSFVTSLKLKGRDTLVTGSYDESIRVWDLRTGQCKKVLSSKDGAKAVSCLDLLDEEAILVAGLYDSGRCLVWDMKTWELISTLSGHNKGIRNVAINEKYLVSVGQDKAIVVWDWRTGTKITRFGQQSNVSLGVSIIDGDKIVAVTVDGIVRTFSISEKKIIGEFNIPKLTGDRTLIQELSGAGGVMMQWFAAHGNTMTVASKDTVVHLEWRESLVEVNEEQEHRIASPLLSRSNSARVDSVVIPSSTPVKQRIRKLSTQSNASSGMGPRHSSSASISGDNSFSSSTSSNASSTHRSRKDSTTSNASNSRATTTPVRSPTLIRSPTLQTSSRPRPRTTSTTSRSASVISPPPWPMPGGNKSLDNFIPTSPSTNFFSFPGSLTSPNPSTNEFQPPKERKTRLAPNLKTPPKVVAIQSTPDMAVGCVYPPKRRVISATRFSSRVGADKLLYSSTFEERKEKPKELTKVEGSDSTNGDNKPSNHTRDSSSTQQNGHQDSSNSKNLNGSTISPISGAWKSLSESLQTSTKNPMSLELDHESCVVGCADGTVYRICFVGSEFGRENQVVEIGEEKVGDGTIKQLLELKERWKELLIPEDAGMDYKGRIKVDLGKKLGFK